MRSIFFVITMGASQKKDFSKGKKEEKDRLMFNEQMEG